MLRVLAVLAAVAAASAHPSWEKVSRAPKAETVDFTVALPMSNADQLDAVFKAVSSPDSAKYGHWLTKSEVNEMTATPRWITNNVLEMLTSSGHSCTARHDSIKCRGTVADVEAMLNTRMHSYKHKKTGDIVHQVDGAYTFPAGFESQVEFVSGLTGFPAEHLGRSRKLEAGEAYTVPETIVAQYGLSGVKGDSSLTQAAAEFQDYPAWSESDLTTFIQQTGIPSFSVTKKIGPFNNNPQPESTLDVQYLGAIGTGVTNWYWTEAGWMFEFTQDILNAGESGSPDIISMSYGWDEEDQCQISPTSAPCMDGGSTAYVQRTNQEFQKVGVTGVTLMASSGDSGAHGRTDPLCQKAKTTPTYPAGSPHILAVGATMYASGYSTGGSAPFCQDNTCKTTGTEIVCSPATGALISSGGGFSEVAPANDWQKAHISAYIASGKSAPAGDFNATGRGYPDVSALGHAYYIQLNGESMAVDGTSCSSPVFAGVTGLLASKMGKKLGPVAELLYKAYGADKSSFIDVTQGNNKCTESSCSCSTGFTATTGWDAVSGLGTPNFPVLSKNVAAILAARKQVLH